MLTLGDTHVTEYAWDYRNRLVSVTDRAVYGDPATQLVTYDYDPFNRLVHKGFDPDGDGPALAEDTFFVYDGNQVVLQFDGTEATDLSHRYLWGPAVDQILADEQLTSPSIPGDILWPLTDHLGTVRDLAVYDDVLDQTTVVNHRVYDAFGNITSETAPTVDHLFAFTGRALDESTGLQNNLDRWYDTQAGRWISVDPKGYEAGDDNLYRYCGNNPTTFTDPSGLDRYIVTNGFHWWIVVEQWGFPSDGSPPVPGCPVVAGYTRLDYDAARGFTFGPADPNTAVVLESGNSYWSTSGPATGFNEWVVYKYYSTPNQDNALLSRWVWMTQNYTWNFGWYLGYYFGFNCVSVSVMWAQYGGEWGSASAPEQVGPIPLLDPSYYRPVFTAPIRFPILR